jgi:hypothetical protein
MSGAASPADAALPAFRPETALEGALFADPELRAGLAWVHRGRGIPRAASDTTSARSSAASTIATRCART